MKKNKHIFFVVWLAMSAIQTNAQVIQGVVLDANSRETIPGVSIYINGTTFGTSTNEKGIFFLNGFPEPPYQIHISAIGYETKTVEILEKEKRDAMTILLNPKALELAETVIKVPENNGWKRFGQQFYRNFIGYSEFADQCRIINPEVLSFIHDKNDFIVRAYAEEPLIILNEALGYRITYWLDFFIYDAKTSIVSFQGTSQFEDLITDRTRRNRAKRWQENRTYAFNGSIQHFFRSLYHNRTEEEGFSVLLSEDGERTTDKRNEINPYIFIRLTPESQKIFAFENYLQVVYNREFEEARYSSTPKTLQRSIISLHNVDGIMIFSNGAFSPANGVLSQFYWAFEKLDKLLPLDFRVEKTIRQGAILNAETHEPLVGASVFINGTPFGTSTEENGLFFLHRFPNPPYQIHVSALGYKTDVFEIPETSENDTKIILLEPQPLELKETTIRARRIRIDGCNADVPGWGMSLGVIDLGAEITVEYKGLFRSVTQTWSAPVTASNCRKATFDGGSGMNGNADCRSNPADWRGDFFSWCAVARFGQALCPYPWRVPTQQDFVDLAWALAPKGHGDGHGTYHMDEMERREFHREFLIKWNGVHHGFSDRSGKVYEQGRFMYHWEWLPPPTPKDPFPSWKLLASEDGVSGEALIYYHSSVDFGRRSGYLTTDENTIENNIKISSHDGINIDESAVLEGGEIRGLAYWEMSFVEEGSWKTFAGDKIYPHGKAVYYWSQSQHSPGFAYVLGLSVGRDAGKPQANREGRWVHLSADRFDARIVVPQAIFDKNFGLTLRCVK
jgi:hypothetical protein